MKSLQKAGGIAALLQGAFFVANLLLIFAILPGLGLAEETLGDFGKLLPALNTAPWLPIFGWLTVPFAIFIIITALALYEHWQPASPDLMQVATVASFVAAAIFIAAGMLIPVAVRELTHMYGQNQTGATAAWLAVNATDDGITFGAIFAYGWWILLFSWAALRSSIRFSQPLDYLGLVLGVALILTFIIQPLEIVDLVLGLVWSVWLGWLLLREQPEAAMMTPAAATL